MNSIEYWKQRIPLLILHLLCMLGLSLFLLVTGNSIDSILWILLVWTLIVFCYLFWQYQSRNSQVRHLLSLAEQLEERYLLSEIIEKPKQAENQIYYELLKMANKSMLEMIGKVQRERTEYKEYIEQWIHEIKTPIAVIKLICENHRSPITKNILVELEKTIRFTEQALYYARMEHTEKDYTIREIPIFSVVHQAIAENKYLLLQHQVCIDLQETEQTIFSDEKWLCFILNQLLVNAVKYSNQQPIIKFYTKRTTNQVNLYIEDNGIGIPAQDLSRIFEKGFTGENGRNHSQNATGIGLYLCKRLCDKLGIGISANSSEYGTTIQLSFSLNHFIYQVITEESVSPPNL